MENLVIKKKGKTTLCEIDPEGLGGLRGVLNDAKAYASQHNCIVEFTFQNLRKGNVVSMQVKVDKNSDIVKLEKLCSTQNNDVGP